VLGVFDARIEAPKGSGGGKIVHSDTFSYTNSRVRFDFPSSINFRAINSVLKLEPSGHRRGSIGFYGYYLLLVINLPEAISCRDIAFDKSKIAIFGYPSCV